MDSGMRGRVATARTCAWADTRAWARRIAGAPTNASRKILHERLTGADTINATAVIAAVTEGVVTLNGWVPRAPMKHDAEEIAWQHRRREDVRQPHHDRRSPDASASRARRAFGNEQQGSGFSSSDRVGHLRARHRRRRRRTGGVTPDHAPVHPSLTAVRENERDGIA
jgi:hypothetical protein